MAFLLFQQTAVQSTILFLFHIVDKILQTWSLVKNSYARDATIQEDMAVSDRLKWCLKIVADSDGHKWLMSVTTAIDG